MKTRALMLSLTLGLAACSSAPTHYYTLMPPVSAGASATSPPAFQFEMSTVRIPVQVDQPQLVVRQDSGTLAILETQRWSAPLVDEFHDALASQLESKLGSRNLEGLPKQPGRPVLAVQTDVRRFESLPGQYALIDVVWSLRLREEGKSARSLTCSSQVRQPAGVELSSLVQAHQQAIGQLAEQMATSARRWSCP
ncbi:membrane integrity-associated transporter subunit PqiC [Pseudomonas sp. PH1b]|uniref:PqiC family protein n=1 Tax=Pseudomonas sp. PH1b TaxID=1397282 RepID=UPI000468D0D5|nr:PqiC family protein [Pseudomonas sp. PH1b]BFD43803.1 PqiC family protein [Pseudomonas sp. FFPRI_1]